MTIGLLIAVIAVTWLGLFVMYWRSRKLQKLVNEKGYLAHHDFVTGLANRHQLTERIELEIKRVKKVTNQHVRGLKAFSDALPDNISKCQ